MRVNPLYVMWFLLIWAPAAGAICAVGLAVCIWCEWRRP